jgi:hypothetical protein
MSASLRQRLTGIGEPAQLPLWLRGSFGRRAPHSVRRAIAGMADPGVDRWYEVGAALAEENTDLSGDSQGATTDGIYWFVCSNNTKEVVAIDNAAHQVATYAPSPVVRMLMWEAAGKPDPDVDEKGLPTFGNDFTPHFGAPSFHDHWIYVPTQGPHGVWRFLPNDGTQLWQQASYLPDDDLFPWCAIHPVTGTLYTSNYGRPHYLRAYDSDTLVYRSPDDVPLGATPLDLDRVQGGTFTAHGRLILVRCDFNAVFCFSSLNGHCFGAQMLGDWGNSGSEVEGVTLRNWQFDGVPAHLHIFELDNDWLSLDDFYLHSFRVPAPLQL